MEGFIRFSVSSSTEAFLKGKYPLGNLLFFHETSVDKKGERDRLRLLRGHRPQGYLRGVPLDTPFVSFLVKGKIPRCGARSSTKGKFTETLVQSKVYNLSVSSSTEAFIKLNTLLMWGYAPHARTSFLFTKKGCKDVSKRRCPLGHLLGYNQICKIFRRMEL